MCITHCYFLPLILKENITINGQYYHWKAKQGIRNAKSKRWRKSFEEQEKAHFKSFQHGMPSPKGKRTWKSYIEHRVAMMTAGMALYATRKYARLRFDKYVESYRASDLFAASLTNKKPSMIYLGAAQMAPNSPIGIKKRLRCPGTRKLLASFKKLGNCVVLFVDEYYTSQTCPICFGRFDQRTKKMRFKVCTDCHPIQTGEPILPREIVSKLSNRQMQRRRKQKRIELEQQQQGEEAGRNNVNQQVRMAANPNRPVKQRLVQKIVTFFKKHQNDAGDWIYAIVRTKIVWHRDIAAAKCILYKGKMELNDFNYSVTHLFL